MVTLDDAVGRWPAGSILITAAPVPLDRHLGHRPAGTVPLAGDGREDDPDVTGRPAVPFGDDAVGVHTGQQSLARRVHPEASATDRLDPHDSAVLRAAAHEERPVSDGPGVP